MKDGHRARRDTGQGGVPLMNPVQKLPPTPPPPHQAVGNGWLSTVPEEPSLQLTAAVRRTV